MLRQVYQPAGAVFLAAHNVLSQRQVQERLREYIIEEGRDCMYLYGFDIGGTKCAVILAKVEGDQVDFLERYEMKTLGDWKKVLDELSENALMIAKKYGLTTGTEGENCVICGDFLWRSFKSRQEVDIIAAESSGLGSGACSGIS